MKTPFVLLYLAANFPKYIPLLWSVLGFNAPFQFGFLEDTGLMGNISYFRFGYSFERI